MKYLIIVVIAGILFFVFKNKIRRSIENRQIKKILVKNVSPDLVYVPILSSRTFDFTIQIDEIGGGRATISVLKNSKKTIIE